MMFQPAPAKAARAADPRREARPPPDTPERETVLVIENTLEDRIELLRRLLARADGRVTPLLKSS